MTRPSLAVERAVARIGDDPLRAWLQEEDRTPVSSDSHGSVLLSTIVLGTLSRPMGSSGATPKRSGSAGATSSAARTGDSGSACR